MTDLTTIGVSIVSTPLVLKLLGPTADYLGGEVKEFTEKRLRNINTIISNAVGKLGGRIEDPGRVPPKVLKGIVNDGSYSDDVVAVEYFGGVLASSRTKYGRDDRGARIAKMIDGLSVYQIRAHYLIYSAVAEVFGNDRHSFNMEEDRRAMQLFVGLEGFVAAMDLAEEELGSALLTHIFHGLSVDGLIEGRWQFGDQESLKGIIRNPPGDGFVCAPSALGAEVFLWACGHGDRPLDFLLSGGVTCAIEGVPTLGGSAKATRGS